MVFFGGYVEGANQFYILTPSGAVRCRTICRRPEGEKWSQDLLSCHCSVLQPNSLDEGESRVGIRAPVHVDPPPEMPNADANAPRRAAYRAKLRHAD